MFFSGEPGAGIPTTKRTIEPTFGATCIDSGRLASLAVDEHQRVRHRTGMHLWQDIVYTELLDPTSLQSLPFGATGTPVYTQLERRGQPMIRLSREIWPRGRTPLRLRVHVSAFPARIIGRIDDMLVVRGETSTHRDRGRAARFGGCGVESSS